MTNTEPTRYRITGACVTVKTATGAGAIGRGGPVVATLYRGSMLPADVPPAQVARLLGMDMIEAIDPATSR